ncbi:hypothetical protein IW261DRAFT_575833 [Armillaria novae-zelandiae]|uniref:Uncharacterized protein n=1 Tax=Armillaria novae-zelandiae TaxID=153914 RepID=A0AA39NYJ8_9AGAR|nr:hypothetical protein IW261DRAFT_575833 [Armillaria novae-zelandiae]
MASKLFGSSVIGLHSSLMSASHRELSVWTPPSLVLADFVHSPNMWRAAHYYWSRHRPLNEIPTLFLPLCTRAFNSCATEARGYLLSVIRARRFFYSRRFCKRLRCHDPLPSDAASISSSPVSRDPDNLDLRTTTKVLQMLSCSHPCSTSHCRISLGLNGKARSIASQVSSVFFIALIAHATQLHASAFSTLKAAYRQDNPRRQYLPRSWFSRPQARLAH